MTTAEQIATILRAALDAARVDVTDDSGQHAGHAGGRESGGGHYCVHIISAQFSGKSTLERHRMVYAALGQEMGTRIHALKIETFTPEEILGKNFYKKVSQNPFKKF